MEVVYQQIPAEIFIKELKFHSLLYPHPDIEPLLPSPLSQTVAYAALSEGKPIGLIVALVWEKIQEAKIYSFFVLPGYRNLKIGSTLFQKIIDTYPDTFITLKYNDAEDTAPYLARLLKKFGWKSEILTTQYFLDPRQFHPPWFISPFPKLPASFSLFDWHQASPSDIALAKAYVAASSDLQMYSPFNPALPPPCKINSLGLRHKGVLCGWVITHKKAPLLLQYTCLYAAPEVRSWGPSIYLLKKAIELHVEHAPEMMGFMEVNPLASPSSWTYFVKRRLAPSATKIQHMMRAYTP